MDQEQKFWLIVWGLLASVIVLLGLGGYAYNANSERLVRDMVEKGADPIDASCAISPGERCIVRFSTR